MKTILALAAALPLLAHAVTFNQLKCTIKDVKVMTRWAIFTMVPLAPSGGITCYAESAVELAAIHVAFTANTSGPAKD